MSTTTIRVTLIEMSSSWNQNRVTKISQPYFQYVPSCLLAGIIFAFQEGLGVWDRDVPQGKLESRVDSKKYGGYASKGVGII